jgi:hypothetical protein
VAWDDDNIIVTSFNWASAVADPDFPWAEIGVHIHAPGIAVATMARLQQIFPELSEETLAIHARVATSPP